MFQEGIGASLIGADSGIPIISFLPVMLFAILFGLSMDYNVFLLSRIHEAYNEGDRPRESVIHGMGRIGKVVVFAGLIMAAVFLGFVTQNDLIGKMFGLGLGLAILIDVLIVRMVIAPAVVTLLGDRAWWLPAWLDRVLPNISLEGRRPEGDLPGGGRGRSGAREGPRLSVAGARRRCRAVQQVAKASWRGRSTQHVGCARSRWRHAPLRWSRARSPRRSMRACRPPRIQVLSNRADLVSGGDAFVRVTLPRGVKASRLRLKARAAQRDGALHKTGRRRLEGVVPAARRARFADRAHPAWRRGTTVRDQPPDRRSRLRRPAGPAVGVPGTARRTPSATRRPRYKFLYLPKGAPTDGATLPGTTRTGQRRSVPALRPEEPAARRQHRHDDDHGRRDGAVHRPARDGLHRPRPVRDRHTVRPEQAVDANGATASVQPPGGHHARILVRHGVQDRRRPSVLEPKVLGGGFMVVAHALDHAGHNCNLLTQAESLVMTKEYVIDHYGTVRWTIGSGCSGGSLVQHQVANAYPGVYQGITPQCSFPDAWSSAMQYEEYFFGLKYLENPTRWDLGVIYDPDATTAFFDHPNPANPVSSRPPSRTRASPRGPAPACRTTRSTTSRRTRAGCAARSRTTWSTRSAATRAASPAAALTTSASSTGSRACGRGGSRPRSSWTSTPTSAGGTSTST